MRLLILGGTSEASALCRALQGRRDVAPILSLAGRTQTPALPAIPHRIGGFGGAEGLRRYLLDQRIDAVVDATHPFAARISAQAIAACAADALPLVAFTRPPWIAEPGDCWTPVSDLDIAARALGATPRRVLLTVGRLGLAAFLAAPQHRYVVRTIDPPNPADLPPDHRLLFARGPFDLAAEEALLRQERIEVIVTKNSGGAAAAAKLAAARALGLPVIVVERPAIGAREDLFSLDAVLGWIAAHRGGSTRDPAP